MAERTHAGEAGTEVVLGVFRANGRLLAAGDELAAGEGLTSARWQVLGAVTLARRTLTVPQIARRMGLRRQSVQATVNRLAEDGLVEAADNPDHRRSPLIGLTDLGRRAYAQLDRRQVAWINELSDGIDAAELETAARVLGELSERLERKDTR
jgi:DNA-binding MarR family transcriptional regulator